MLFFLIKDARDIQLLINKTKEGKTKHVVQTITSNEAMTGLSWKPKCEQLTKPIITKDIKKET